MKLSRGVVRFNFNWCCALLPFLVLFANLARMIAQNNIIYFGSITIVGVIGFFLLLDKSRISGKPLFLSLTALFCATAAINVFLVKNVELTNVAQEAALMGVTALMLLYKPTRLQAWASYWIVAVIFLSYYLRGYHPSRVLSSSSNYISVILILFIVLYYQALEGCDVTLLRLAPAVTCFLFSVWGRGRGGILSSAILLVGLLLIRITTASKRGRRLLFVAILLIIAATAVIIAGTYSLSRFSWLLGSYQTEGLLDVSRAGMWKEYIQTTFDSAYNVVFGTSFSQMPLISRFSSNPHNSFIYLHLTHGILPTVILLVLLVRSLVTYMKKKEYMSALALFVLCVRAFTDKFIFMQYGMPVMMYLILAPWVGSEQRFREENELPRRNTAGVVRSV